MKELTAWLALQAKRASRSILLEDALLGDRFKAYAFYRLRFFFSRYFVALILHTLKAILLFRFFTLRQFQAIVLLQVVSGLISSFWWGSLEAMRSRVRLLQRQGKPHRITGEIRRWMSFSIRLAIFTALLTVLWALWKALSPGSRFGPAELFIVSIGARLSLTFVTRCYHSGIYSLRRVYRPLPTILATELLSFASVLALWPLLHLWSLPLANIFSALLATAFMLHYTSRTYRQLGFLPWPVARGKAFKLPAGRSWREWLSGGLSYCLMHLDSILVLGLFPAGLGSRGAIRLAVLMFLLSPLVRAGFDWAQLFYFDLKRLEIPLQQRLKERFEKNILQLAGIIGLVLWGISAVTGTIFYVRSLGLLYILLLFFFLSRSLLAALQMKAYAEGSYSMLLASGALSLSGLIAIGQFISDETAKLGWLVSTIVASALLIVVQRLKAKPLRKDREIRCLHDWISEIRAIRRPLAVSAAAFSNITDGKYRQKSTDKDRWSHLQLAELMAIRLAHRGAVTILSSSRIAWYEPEQGARRISPSWILRQGAGLIESLATIGKQADGPSAVHAMRAAHLLGPEFPISKKRTSGVTSHIVRDTFARLAPQGIVFSPDEPAHPLLASLSSRERRDILWDATAYLSELRLERRRSPFHVTAYCEAGALRLIFLLDGQTPRRIRAKWESTIRRLNLEAASSDISIAS